MNRFLLSMIIVAALSAGSDGLIAADIPQAEWSEYYGGGSTEYGFSGQQTVDGGYIFAGTTRSIGAGSYDFYLVKTDGLGNRDWFGTFGGSSSDEARSVQQTSDGGYILAGWTESFGSGNKDFYLVKTNDIGIEEWSNAFGGTSLDEAHSVRQTADGGYIVAGRTSSFGAGSYDFYLIKTDSSGNEIWSQTIGDAESNKAYSVRQTADGGYIIVGESGTFAGTIDVYLVKTDGFGVVEWSQTYDAGGWIERGYAVEQTEDGGFIVTGVNYSTGAGGGDVYLIKTDGNGVASWRRSYGGTDEDIGYSVKETEHGGFIIAGATWSFGAGASDIYLLQVDSSGYEDWSQTFGGTAAEEAWSIEKTSDNGYILAGSTLSYGYGHYDMYMIKIAGDDLKEWSQIYEGYGNYWGFSLQQTAPDNGYIVAGVATDMFGTGNDVNLIKTDSDGVEEWRQFFGGADDDWGHSVIQTPSDNGYLIAGRTASYGAGLYDVYLIKTDSGGSEIWSQTYGGTDDDGARSVQQTSDGGFIMAGYTGHFPVTPLYDVYLIKTDSGGTVEWSQTYGEADDDYAYSVRQTMPDNGYIIAGATNSSGAGGYDVYLIKTDSFGNELWSQTYGGAGNDFGFSVLQIGGGDYVIAGCTGSFGSGSYEAYLIKTDSSGNEIWSRTFGGAGGDFGYSLKQTTDGGFIITGETESFGAGDVDVYLIKTDSGGIEEWSDNFGGFDSDVGQAVVQAVDGDYVVAGYTYSYGAGGGAAYLLKINGSLSADPVPDIKANGLDGPLSIPVGTNLNVTIALDAGMQSGADADWWVILDSPFGYYYHEFFNNMWFSGIGTADQTPLYNMSSFEVLDFSGIPIGAYRFYFAVDMVMNGTIDMGQIYYDSVDVTVTP